MSLIVVTDSSFVGSLQFYDGASQLVNHSSSYSQHESCAASSAPSRPIVSKAPPIEGPTLSGKATRSISTMVTGMFQRPLTTTVPLPALLPLLPLLPTSLYLNRGYTVWFHLCSLAHVPTRSAFLRRFLILQGSAICLGWYAAIVNEYLSEGNFCHALYRNMPGWIVDGIVQQQQQGDSTDNNYVILDTYQAYMYKALAHLLDALGHPGLVCLFYILHRRSGENWRHVLSWEVILAGWYASRLWSVVHSHHNRGTWDLWYFGHDVYVLNDVGVYRTAYIAEGLCFALAILWKLCLEERGEESKLMSQQQQKQERWMELSDDPVMMQVAEDYSEVVVPPGENSGKHNDTKPMLVHSETAESLTSVSTASGRMMSKFK